MAKLTAKMQAFVNEYLCDDLDQTQAAIRAGYSTKSATKIASELMRKPAVKEAIDKAMAERSKRTGVNIDRVVRELAKVAFANAANVIDFGGATVKRDATEDDTAAIASVKVKIIPGGDGDGVEREIKMADKLKALELLGKHMNMFTDKLQVNGALPVQIADDVPNPQIEKAGVQPAIIKEILRHASYAQTIEYTHIDRQTKLDALKSITPNLHPKHEKSP